jgi:type I restriction enzyme, S subunit
MVGFPKYENYKDSGVEWLREIPAHWKLQSIRAITQLKSEKNRPDLPVLSVYREYGVLFKDSRDDNHNATSLDISSYKAVEVGDLVVNKMKAWQGSMGISQFQGIVSPAYITCRVNANIVEPKFLHYLLRSKPYIGIYNALSYGVRVGQWDMHYEDFKKIPLPLPTMEEQKRISDFIDRKTTEIDQAIAQKQRLIELLKEQKAILIDRAVNIGLKRNAQMKDSGFEWLGESPEHWEILRAKYLFKEVDERSQTGKEELLSVSHITGVTPRSEKNVNMFMAEDYSGSKLCRKDDLVINIMWAWMGALGIANQTGIVSSSYGVFRQIKSNTFNSWYLEHLLRSKKYVAQYNRISTGLHSSRLRLYARMFLNMEILLPPKEEQDKIEFVTTQQTAEIDTAINAINHEIESIGEIRSILIAQAVTGKIKL